VIWGGRAIDDKRSISLTPSGTQLEMHYTALSFVAPERIRFKYKLEGFDRDWIEAGRRRVAYYTNLPPGRYRFRVVASDNANAWNDASALLDLQLRPHFYQTYWFYVVITFSVLMLALALHRIRVRRLKIRKEELERLVKTRTKDLLETTQELQAANNRQAEFVSGISHGLKTPLTLIRLYGETLLFGSAFPEEVRRDYYQIITRESERLTHLVDNVLDFSRIKRGVKQYSIQEGDMRPAVDETVRAHAQHLRRGGFTVNINFATDLGPVRFDAVALSEVVSNLLDNAAKYCGDKKQISVSLRSDSSAVVLEIEDQGLGIPYSEQERIFEQFYRGSNSTDKGGYGLGLFLVKHIMDAHGGTIDVKSKPGHGSLFRLIFPVNHNGLRRRKLGRERSNGTQDS